MSRRPILAIALLAGGAATAAAGAQRAALHDFNAGAPGSVPSTFTFAGMRQPQPGTWLLRGEARAGYLVHTGDPTLTGFSLAIAPDAPRADLSASVRIRFPQTPRLAGVVWRYTDPRNYYAAVLDLQKANVSLYRVADGNRIFLESEDGLELDAGAWHTLKATHDDAVITVSLGGIRVFNERDRRGARLAAGRAGVIAAGDADVWFDDLRIEARSGRD